ncbi:transposase [Alkalicoccus daliensis]|uniref:Transposase IS200 like n=1 Tax=Alkalicoccus daliensis TaxID=745820 RepID=A0A1H0J2H3_9BACI|nr:transposase [Alkalicoccus daliensis]SDO37944.1 Transposase IS200 like [Alkalicoccus daliensis]
MPRLKSSVFTWHLYLQSKDSIPIFKDAADQGQYLDFVLEAKKVFQFDLHAYVILDHKVHLLLHSRTRQPSIIMQRIHTNYAVYFNDRYKKNPELPSLQFKLRPVSSLRYFMEITKYIHLCPLFYAAADAPESYPWSSYKQYTQQNKGPVDNELMLRCFPKDSQTSCRQFHERELDAVPSLADLEEILQAYLRTLDLLYTKKQGTMMIRESEVEIQTDT